MPPRELLVALSAVAVSAALGYSIWSALSGSSSKQKVHRVSSIVIYPIKSCKGIELQKSRTDRYGFELDRNWILVFADTGLFVTAREIPRMVLVETALDFDSPLNDSDPTRLYDRGGYLVITIPGKQPQKVRFPRKPSAATRVVDVWGKPTLGLDEGDEIAQYLSEYLGREVRLLVKDPRHVRKPNMAYTPRRDLFDDEPQTAFADGFPFLITSEASLVDLNRRVAAKVPGSKPLTMARFRPNIVVSDGPDAVQPYAEDKWTCLAINGAEWLGTKKCGRCTIPSVDVETGEQGSEPTKILNAYRRIDKGNKFEACFGMNMLCRKVGNWVHVGDLVEILEEKEIIMVSKEVSLQMEGGPRPVPSITLVPQ